MPAIAITQVAQNVFYYHWLTNIAGAQHFFFNAGLPVVNNERARFDHELITKLLRR